MEETLVHLADSNTEMSCGINPDCILITTVKRGCVKNPKRLKAYKDFYENLTFVKINGEVMMNRNHKGILYLREDSLVPPESFRTSHEYDEDRMSYEMHFKDSDLAKDWDIHTYDELLKVNAYLYRMFQFICKLHLTNFGLLAKLLPDNVYKQGNGVILSTLAAPAVECRNELTGMLEDVTPLDSDLVGEGMFSIDILCPCCTTALIESHKIFELLIRVKNVLSDKHINLLKCMFCEEHCTEKTVSLSDVLKENETVNETLKNMMLNMTLISRKNVELHDLIKSSEN